MTVSPANSYASGAKVAPRTRAFRRANLVLHVILSVGWLGAVLAYLPLAITGLTSVDPDTVKGTYRAMEQIGWFAIVPLSLGAFISGLIQSLITDWGLFRHYWIVVKLLLTVVSTTVLMLHMPLVSRVASMASTMTLPLAPPGTLQKQLLFHAAGGLAVLVVITVISIFKPWGRTPFGRTAA